MTTIETRLSELRELSNVRVLTDAEWQEWFAIKKEQGKLIDPATCEVDFIYGNDGDEYSLCTHDRRYDEIRGSVGRVFFAGNAGCTTWGWVAFRDIPEEIRKKLEDKRRAADAEGWRQIFAIKDQTDARREQRQ